jgi:hypothetical protein
VGVTDQAIVKGSSEDNLANLGLFFYGLVNKGLYGLGKELLTMVTDVPRLFGIGTKEGFQSQLFRMSENIHGFNDALRAAGGLIAAPFLSIWSLGEAIASGDPEAAGEQLAGNLPFPSRLGRISRPAAKLSTVTGFLRSAGGAFIDNLKPPFLNETIAIGGGIRGLASSIAKRVPGAYDAVGLAIFQYHALGAGFVIRNTAEIAGSRITAGVNAAVQRIHAAPSIREMASQAHKAVRQSRQSSLQVRGERGSRQGGTHRRGRKKHPGPAR